MYNYPHTIDNGQGESITFLRRVKNGNEEYLEVENVVLPNHGPPMHVHFKQAESLTVKKGRIGIRLPGEAPKFFGVGETATFEAGIAHKFWNAGTEPLECTGWIKPAHNVEYFLTEMYKTTKENGGKRPGFFESAYLANRYKTEFDMAEIPGFVKSVIFPAVIGVGKLLGKYERYKNAPEPVK